MTAPHKPNRHLYAYAGAVLAALFFAPNGTSAAILVPTNLGLMGYWSFNEGTSTTAVDFSGFRRDGTLQGATLPSRIIGKVGKALTFNGSTARVSLSGSVTVPAAVTISAWIKTSSSGQIPIFSNRSGAGTTYFGMTGGKFFVYDSNGSPSPAMSSNNASVNSNTWHHVVWTSSGSEANMYIDGVFDSSQSQSRSATSGGTYIGYDASNNEYFPGSIDEVRMYNRVLSPAEVLALYRSGGGAVKVPTATGLVGYWSFNEGTTTVAGDYSGRRNDGTLSTSALWAAGRLGKALSFDGTSGNIVTIPNAPSLNISSAITLSAWVYPTKNTGVQNVISKSSSVFNSGYIFPRTDDGWTNTVFYLNIGGSWQTFSVPFGASRMNSWHHLIATYDGSTMAIYIDGVLANSRAQTGSIAVNTNSLAIGNQPGYSELYGGKVDEVRVYNRALSAAEAAALYASGGTVLNASKNNFLTSGLVGLWSFDGKDINWGTGRAYDGSRQGNDGSLIGMGTTTSPAIGKIGQALKFNGSSQNVNAGNAASLQLSNGTIVAWIKTPGAGSGYRAIVTKQFAYSMFMLNNQFGFYDWSGGTFRNSSQSPNDNRWHHVACSFQSGVANGTLCYLDGVLVLTSIMTVSGQTEPFLIAEGNTADQYFAGLIDDVRIYNRALSAAEIAQLYNAGR